MIAMGIPEIIIICWLLFAPNGDIICICNDGSAPTPAAHARPLKATRGQARSVSAKPAESALNR